MRANKYASTDYTLDDICDLVGPGITAIEVSNRIDITERGARYRLDQLMQAGRVTRTHEMRYGYERPVYIYRRVK